MVNLKEALSPLLQRNRPDEECGSPFYAEPLQARHGSSAEKEEEEDPPESTLQASPPVSSNNVA